MLRASVSTLLVLFSLTASAQTDGGVTSSPAPAVQDTDSLRRDFEQKLDAARREVDDLRKEMRAQLATQSVAQGWQQDWVDEKRKLELVTFDGYLRMRPDLFWRFDLGSGSDQAGYSLWPANPNSATERTNVGVNMRFRFEPTINISEEVRIRTQIDALDNIVWGSTPDYAYSRNGGGYWSDRNEFSIFSQSQTAPRAGVNSLNDSIMMKRVWGEVSTPVGILRFGRMGSHWGLGVLHNDGNGIDNDWGDTVDRVSFTAEPFAGFYITPMLDVNITGTTSLRLPEGGQPFNLSNYDDGINYIIAVARRDTDTEARAKLDSGQTVFNYGLHFSYRNQRTDSVDALSQPFTMDGTNQAQQNSPATYVRREANLFIPDVWAKLERKNFRLEGEFAAILGTLGNRALSGANALQPGENQRLDVWQFAAVVQGEYKLLNGDLEIGGEVGFASGDNAPGFGNAPRRKSSGLAGDIDGPQYRCSAMGGCSDNTIRNFRFNRDYRVDMILYREILGGVTDSLYVKPKVQYRITQGLNIFGAGIYSRAIFAESTPSGGNDAVAPPDANLGIELNAGARYETEDGFYAQAQYGILFPLGGFNRQDAATRTSAPLVNAQAFRGVFGIKF